MQQNNSLFKHSQAIRLVIGVIIFSTLFSCIPQKEMLYLQDQDNEKGYENPYTELKSITNRYIIQTNDLLFVNVSSPDSKISQFFNQGSRNSGSTTQRSGNYFQYMVDDSMNIDFPYIGKINLDSCTINMARERIENALKPFLKEYNLVVRMGSNTFTTLGEFKSQGIQSMQKEQITIFEAIATAGGITTYGKRKKLRLLRQLPDGPVTYTIDLTDKNIVNSEYYYIYPNDLLYIRPMKAKQIGIGESFSLGLITAGIAFYVTITNLLN